MDKQAPASDDEQIIAECAKRMQLSIGYDSENRKLMLDDLAFLNGDQWDPMIKAERAADRRPCLTVNKLPTTLHQLTNTQRRNVPGIKVSPVGETVMKLAEIVQGAIRSIEYRSKASVCYDTAINGAAAIGIGYFRLTTKYVSPDSFDQEIVFKRVRNPFTVYPDPNSVEVDGSDYQWVIISEKITRIDFKLQYPDADPASFDIVRGMGDDFTDWAGGDDLRIAEYYRIHNTPATAVLLSNGESGWKDKLLQMPPGVSIVRERKSMRPTVQWFKLTATQILERTDIPCKWIPVFPVYGDELDINGKVFRRGMVRNAKDPARMYNYWMTCATEEIGLRQRIPYIGAEGQFEGHEEKWRLANNRSFPYLEYKLKSLGGQLAPPPMRQPMTDVPVGVLAMASQANDDIKATTGFFDASLGARSNETSGTAINARDRQGETANYHYTDNLNTTLIHAGRCIIDMWPKVYDGTRTLETMAIDRKISSVTINQPVTEADPETGAAVTKVLNDMRSAEFAVTVSAGPSFDTVRQEAVEGMIETARNWPKLMDVAGDKVIRSMDWPMAEQIADRIEKTIPQELRDGEDGAEQQDDMVDTPKGPIPKAQVGQLLGEMEQMLNQLQEELKVAKAGTEKAQIAANASIEVAKIKAFSAEEVEELRGFVALLKEKMRPPPSLTADVLSNEGNQGASS